jgi:hypothetical protein
MSLSETNIALLLFNNNNIATVVFSPYFDHFEPARQ